MKIIRSTFGRLALLSVFVFLLLGAVPAQARSWKISRFDANIAIDKDGRAVVHETLDILFEGEFHGIYRTVPIHYPGQHGENYTLVVKLISANADGHELKVDSNRRGDYREWKIYLDGATDTTKHVEIFYEVANPIRHFPDFDEFYWNVTGNDWPVPIDAASATISFPANANGLRAQAFTGAYGSKEQDADASVEGTVVNIRSNNPLPIRGGMTADVYIPEGILARPGPLAKAWLFIRSNPVTLLPLLALLVMGPLWWFIGKDPDPGLSVAPQYEPPQGMTPAEVGTMIDDSTDPRDITCTLVDLAARGYLRIEETEPSGLIFKTKNYSFHKTEKPWENLAPHELAMLTHMFATGNPATLSGMKYEFYQYLPGIKRSIMDSLKDKGVYRVDPASGTAYMVGGALAVFGLGWVVALPSGIGLFDSGVLSFVMMGIAAVIVFLFGRQMTAKSFYGAQAWVHVKGFQEFMNRVDRDRLKTMPPDTFEKYLAFAMALGVEERWAQAFQGLVQQPPSWFYGPGYGPNYIFSPVDFSRGMNSMASSTQEAFVAAPRASSSGSGFSSGGGFSGGGFSGGGFGGGGGGAF